MSAVTATRRGRVAAERDMRDTVTIERLATESTDAETGVVTRTYTTIYAGRAKIQQARPQISPSEVGEASVYIGHLALHLPVTDTTAAAGPDDLVTVTACPLDASLVGRTFHLRGPAHKSYATARRWPMVEVSG